MYITVLITVAAIIGALAFHIFLALSYRVFVVDGSEACILGWYLVGILIPLALLVAGWGVSVAQNLNSSVAGFQVRINRQTNPEALQFVGFDNIVSNIAAGIVLGMYMHGIAAYDS
ncbi:hypothetical protein HK100_008999 [Physocladia obscura]|uniref:Uncharacterized protein n=1 Tax=Physocladia obscura TaxID=109957 RepID=A0AAD5T3K4_9FUNG|nr:hypothetical protein HK100_008999 [Physocladia obscura]